MVIVTKGDYIWIEPKARGEFDVAIGALVKQVWFFPHVQQIRQRSVNRHNPVLAGELAPNMK